MSIDYLGNPQAARIQTARVFAALPAAGAWDATPTEVICIGMDDALFLLRYTRAAAGGDMQYRVEISPYIQDGDAPAGHPAWGRASIFAAGGVVSGADTLSNIQRNDSEYGSTGAAAEDFVYGVLELRGTVQRIRIPCRESGAIGTPGSCSVDVSFAVRNG